MSPPVLPPIKPMLAKSVGNRLPGDDSDVGGGAGGDLIFEPKWDGFRCIVFRDGDELLLQSRNEKPFERYVPEIVGPMKAQLPQRCVIDGELVVVTEGCLDFEALGQRIHPAESRINRLAEETPSSFIAFDLLGLGDTDLREEPFRERRRLLENALSGVVPPVYLTPTTTDRELAWDWFKRFEGAGLDGLIAKPPGGTYVENRRVQFKVKHKRTADCVVAGWRPHKKGDGVGSLLLGVNADGHLHHVGVATSFTVKRRAELVDEIAHLAMADGEIGEHPWSRWERVEAHDGSMRMPGAPSRWGAQKDPSWIPLHPTDVVEVAYEGLLSGRFRHSSRFVQWRPDRNPESCTYDQFEPLEPVTLDQIVGG